MPDPDRLIGLPLFGGYRVTRKIGEGGMGAVYVAENRELQKRLAVKVLLPDRITSPTATKRFLAEARAASAINHRNIIEIIDSSTLPDGRHYILMEYLEGTTLRRYARGLGPMPVDVSLAILAQVCSGLQAAHERGIVHRDLKPSNIFIAPQPDNPYFAKLLDFGIAKLEDPGLAGDVETKSHTVAGTPNYMSPEQARALRDVDHRTDIYSLGVIAYEILSGRLPYKAQSIGDLVFQQASTKPPPLAHLRADLPKPWYTVIHAAISLDQDARPRSALELAHQLIQSTPHGEQIARATASLLFASTNPSDLSSRSSSAERLGSSDWSIESMPDVPVRSMTQSVADDGFPAAVSDMTKAASPAALAQSSSGSQLSAPQTVPSVPAAEPPPTTLGMSASQISARPVSTGGKRLAIAATLLIGAAAGGLAIFLWIDSQRAAATAPDDPPRAAPASPAANPVVKPLADEPPPVAIDAGAAAVAPDPPDAAPPPPDAAPRHSSERPGRPNKPKKPRGGDGEPPGDDALFDGRK